LKSIVFFLKHRFHILHFSNSTGLFTKPSGCHYTKYRFSPDIGTGSSSKTSRKLPIVWEEIMKTYRKSIKKNQKATSCNWLDLETLKILTDYAQKSPWLLLTQT
jgi:hypothetical protein